MFLASKVKKLGTPKNSIILFALNIIRVSYNLDFCTEETKEDGSSDDNLLAQLIDENEDNFKETTTERKTTVRGINSLVERKTRESGEENDIDRDDSLVDEERKADVSDSTFFENHYRSNDTKKIFEPKEQFSWI